MSTKLTEKQLVLRAHDAGLAIYPRYDNKQRRVYDICAREAQGRPDLSRIADGATGLTNREVAAFLSGVVWGQRWEPEGEAS